jgi:NADH-quinone oxidoreductase subunit D
MDGERILEAEPTIGYIHRAFEKIAENRPFYKLHRLQIVWTTVRPINNMGWWMTLENYLILKCLNVLSIWVIIMELARITDHLICNSILGVDTGAYTGFLYVFNLEKGIWNLWRNLWCSFNNKHG